MKIEWIDQGSTPILYADGRGLEKNELLFFVTRVHKKLRESTGEYHVLYNLQDVALPLGILDTMAKLVKANEIHAIKSAFVGMDQINEKTIRRINGFISDTTERKLFQSEKEAMEWLVM